MNKHSVILAMALLFLSVFGCNDEKPTPSGLEYHISPSVLEVSFDGNSGVREIGIETNVLDLEVRVPQSGSWCVAEIIDNHLRLTVERNSSVTMPRSVGVTLQSSSNSKISVSVNVLQEKGTKPPDIPLAEDAKLSVASSIASEALGGRGIALSHDGDMNTFYQSREVASFPVTLIYNFADAPSIDYLFYYARSDGSVNGNIQKFELWLSQGGGLEKYGEYDFNGTSGRIDFASALTNISQIQFRVLTATGGMVSCAEMEFFQRNPDTFDYLTIFTDHSCTALKTNITKSDIEDISVEFFRDLALKIFENRYDTEFRVQEFRAWPHPDTQAIENRTSSYSIRDNPAGIFVREDNDLIVFLDATHGHAISIVTQDLASTPQGVTGFGTVHSYSLRQGMNIIKMKGRGLIYVQYYLRDFATAPKIKIHFATGSVNGYFDSQKHQAEDWQKLLNNAVDSYFDLVGQYYHMTMYTADFKQYTPDGKALIDKYDEMTRLQHEFMGLYKYDRVYKNRAYLHVCNSGYGWMYAAWNHMGTQRGAVRDILDLNKISTTDYMWGPAHELGHINQVNPGLKWLGMGEVSNNIFSNLVVTSFGVRSALMTWPASGYTTLYENGFNTILNQNTPFILNTDALVLLVPFWQLKLYLHDVLGLDFYADINHYMMVNPIPTTPATDGRHQLNFVRAACIVSELDLLDFFEAWGFLTPINQVVYNAQFTVTQASVNELKAEINAKGYPKPPKDFTRITDETVDDFR